MIDELADSLAQEATYASPEKVEQRLETMARLIATARLHLADRSYLGALRCVAAASAHGPWLTGAIAQLEIAQERRGHE